MTKLYHTVERKCPNCHITLDVMAKVAESSEYKPKNGDLTVCGHCASVLVYYENQDPKLASNEDFSKLNSISALSLVITRILVKRNIQHHDDETHTRH